MAIWIPSSRQASSKVSENMSSQPNDLPAVDENRLIAERRTKLAALRAAGPAYPNDFRPASHVATLHGAHDEADSALLQAARLRARGRGRAMRSAERRGGKGGGRTRRCAE